MNSKAAVICVAVALAGQVLKEGAGLGGESEIESGYQVGSSLLINVTTISLALGSAFNRSEFTTRQIIVGLTIFTLVAPIALIIGMSVGELHPIVNVVLLSLTTGIYLYFACSEVFVKEFSHGSGASAVAKIIAIIIGVLIILGLVFIESGHSHGAESVVADMCMSMVDDHDDHDHRRF